MEKVKKIVFSLIRPNPRLPAIINKSRIYNTYIALMEIGMIFFWLIVPGRT